MYVMICQHVYWPDIRDSVQKEATNCDTCQCTKLSNKKCGKLTAKLSEEIPQNKLCVDLLGPYFIKIKGRKENLHSKDVMMMDSVIGWFEIAQYEDKEAISIANLVKAMWLSIYHRPIEITYDQGKDFIRHEFRKSLIKMEYEITAKPITLVNLMSNEILERIH